MKRLTNICSLLSVIVIIIGFILGYFSSLNFRREFIEIYFNNFEKFYFNFSILKLILIKNLIVSLFLSVGGYFTAGVLTILVLLWNGVNLGSLFTILNYTNLNIYEFTSLFMIHGIFEFVAFILFANIGFSGYCFFAHIFKKKEIKIKLNPKHFLIPSLILLFAAILETFLISNF